jgi:hypothetical protein
MISSISQRWIHLKGLKIKLKLFLDNFPNATLHPVPRPFRGQNFFAGHAAMIQEAPYRIIRVSSKSKSGF